MEIQPVSIHCRHLCGNHLCCSPTHLAFGTPAENARDNTLNEGWKNAKVDDNIVLQMRKDFVAGKSHTQISKEVGLSAGRARKIILKKAYLHVDAGEVDEIISKVLPGKKRVSDDEVRDIRKQYLRGKTNKDILLDYTHVTIDTIIHITSNRGYTDVTNDQEMIDLLATQRNVGRAHRSHILEDDVRFIENSLK